MKTGKSSKTAGNAEMVTNKPVMTEILTDPEEKTVPDKKGSLIYLGPTIAGIVRHSIVFKEGILPERTRKCVEEMPVMEKLFVEVDRLPEAVKELHKEQSVLRVVYEQAVQRFLRR